ncbi:MAG: hypothetical protein D9V47_00925 [Clostridia bacterium]|nr:MAG: hypothetical protein D9V47_00925 [Clostridia bacterium]
MFSETERIEHHLSEEPIERIRRLVEFMRENQRWLDAFNAYCNSPAP